MGIIRPLDSMARDHTERAVEVIAEIMDDPLQEAKDRLKAAQEILDRGHGKPLAATISLPPSKVMQARIAAMSDEDLMEAVRGHELPRLVPQAQPAEDFSDDPLLK